RRSDSPPEDPGHAGFPAPHHPGTAAHHPHAHARHSLHPPEPGASMLGMTDCAISPQAATPASPAEIPKPRLHPQDDHHPGDSAPPSPAPPPAASETEEPAS